MQKSYKVKLDDIINDLSFFLEKDFSSRFKNLTEKEDRQLFFLARLLVRLKHLREDIKEKEKVIAFSKTIDTYRKLTNNILS